MARNVQKMLEMVRKGNGKASKGWKCPENARNGLQCEKSMQERKR